MNQLPSGLVEVIRHQVMPEDEGRMIRDIIRSRVGLSRGLMRKVLSSGGLSLNGRPAFMGNRAQSGDVILLCAEPSSSEDILPEALPLNVFYEDE
ncbi:MAG: pseudouridine synthase, RluA family, partial [Bacilli bacterium]|nr:pseudouridine synthase, RluA family [Bacilli bacterium]